MNDSPTLASVPALPENRAAVGSRFWALLLGVIAPIACLVANVEALCTGSSMFDLLGDAELAQPLFFACFVIGCISMTLGVLVRRPSPRLAGWLAGALVVAALPSLVALLMVLPRVLIGIVLPVVAMFNPYGFGIAIPALLGSLPAYIAVVLWLRRAWRLYRGVPREQGVSIGRPFLGGAGAALALVVGIQLLTYMYISQATQTLIQGDLGQAPAATAALESAFWCGERCSEPLRPAFLATQDPQRQQVLREAYRRLEGKAIDAPEAIGGCY